jgi:hypothetical protein
MASFQTTMYSSGGQRLLLLLALAQLHGASARGGKFKLGDHRVGPWIGMKHR